MVETGPLQVDRVVKLLRGHRVRVARALVRQTRAFVPRYETLDDQALERNFLSLLLGVERVLEFDDDAPLLEVAAHVAQLRAAMGFRIEDFAIAALTFLPVVRRFIVESATSMEQGLADYELFEGVALPLIGRAANIFLEATDDPTAPGQSSFERQATKPMRALRIERVTGEASEEDAVTQKGNSPFG